MSDTVFKWVDLLIKGIGVALITAAISIYSISEQHTQNQIARQDQRFDAAIQFGSSQKELDVNLGMQLLDDFITHYLQTQSADTEQDIRQNILMLRLIALNFQDVPLNLKPLFEDLDERLQRLQPPAEDRPDRPSLAEATRDELRVRLRGVAKELANRQAFRLTFLGGNMQEEIFRIVEKPEASRGAGQDVHYFRYIPYGVQVHEIGDDQVRVLIQETVYDEKGEIDTANARTFGPFQLSYFDIPLVDNIKIDDNTRIALNLREIDGPVVRIRLMRFRNDLAADRFDVKEMSREFFQDPQGGGRQPTWLEQLFGAEG